MLVKPNGLPKLSDSKLGSAPALGFGTSGLGHFKNKRNAVHSLEVAYENGITYFDTAPLYAYGWAEKLLGSFIKDKRNSVLIATKIGLLPSRILSSLPYDILSVTRKVIKGTVLKDPEKTSAVIHPPAPILFDFKWAQKHFEQSLRRLKTEYVDVLLLHEATVHFANADETIEFMHHVVSTGKARAVGLGSDKSKLNDTRQLAHEYTVLQYEYSLLDKPNEIKPGRKVNLHGLFRNMNYIKSISNDNTLSKEIFKYSKLDISKPTDRLELCLMAAQHLHQNGMTLFSATKDHHIKETISTWNKIQLKDDQMTDILSVIRKHTLHI